MLGCRNFKRSSLSMQTFSEMLCVGSYRTYITPGNSVILAGDNATFTCQSHYTPPYWLFYGLTPGATPCAFDSSMLNTGITLCSAASRISVTYSSQQPNETALTILTTELADAGIYTCGSHDPSVRNWTSSIIVGVIGTHIPGLTARMVNLRRNHTR